MEKTLEALDNLIAKILNTIVSTKFWVTVVTMAIGALTILKGGGSWLEAVLGALMIVAGGTTYTITKYRQNVEYIRQNMRGLQQSPAEMKSSSASVPPSLGSPSPAAVPSPAIDWAQFWDEVKATQERLMRQTPGKKSTFAFWEALQIVGRQYDAQDLDDLYAYARAMYEASLQWWKEIAGFDYLEAVEKGVPKEFQSGICPTSDLTLWIRSSNNSGAFKFCVQEIRNAARKLNTINSLYSLSDDELKEFWKKFPDKSLAYIYNTV